MSCACSFLHFKIRIPSFNCRDFSELHEKLSYTITLGSMSLLNCEIYQRVRVSRVADTDLLLLISHLIRSPGSIPGLRWVRRNQTNKTNKNIYYITHMKHYSNTLILQVYIKLMLFRQLYACIILNFALNDRISKYLDAKWTSQLLLWWMRYT